MNHCQIREILVRALVAMFVIASVGAGRLRACSCTVPLTPSKCSDLNMVGPSFVGTVIDIENPPDGRPGADQSGLSRYRFRVDEDISGFPEKEVDIYSERGMADCSYHFRLGESYFVVPTRANGAPAVGGKDALAEPLMAWMCGLTQPAATAAALLRQLRARKTGASVVGVLRTEPGPDDYNHRIAGARLELRNETLSFSTTTDPRGHYELDGVPAGKYEVAIKVPPEYQGAKGAAIAGPAAPATITIGHHTCYEKDIFTRLKGQFGPP